MSESYRQTADRVLAMLQRMDLNSGEKINLDTLKNAGFGFH